MFRRSETDPDFPRGGLLWRLVLGCLVVVLAAGGATAVFVLEQVHTVVQDLRANKPLPVDRRVLAPDYYGGPETLLLVGDDWRPQTKYYRRAVPHLANEMLLVRIDPSKPWISMMSIPRELWVPIQTPGGTIGPTRLNAAYTFGTTYLVDTIKQITGLQVNHVIAATFGRFERAIDELGCVYSTVDERYYHNNADGGAQYQNIDLQPGYQCLSGSQAEQFVSYRHTDTSQIRDARDQAFLLDVKKQYGPELAASVGKFEKIFGQTVQTDAGLQSQTEILNFADLLITAAGLRVRQVPFAATPLPNGDLSATPEQIHEAAHNFLFGGAPPPAGQTASVARSVHHHGAISHLPLTPTLAANVAAERGATANLPFPAEFPKVQDLSGSGAYPLSPQCTPGTQACVRSYLLPGPGGRMYPTYVAVFSNGQLGQFYDVQGTTWTGAPLFASPNQTVRVGRRIYDLYYEGTQLDMVAWHEYGAVYWVRNTLTNAMDSGELLAIAEQMVPVAGAPPITGNPRSPAASSPVSLKPVSVPVLPTAKAATSTRQTIGSLAGLLALVLLPGLAILSIRQRLLARRLRLELHSNLRLAAELGAALPLPAALPLVASAPARPAPAETDFSDRRNYALPRRRVLSVLPAVVVALIAAGVAAYLLTRGGHASPRSTRLAARHSVLATASPTAPVAVLNASGQAGAAAALAKHLVSQRVLVIGTGNVSEALARGDWVLYGAGQRAQAQELAALLRLPATRLAPIDANARAAAGPGAQLVVVIA